MMSKVRSQPHFLQNLRRNLRATNFFADTSRDKDTSVVGAMSALMPNWQQRLTHGTGRIREGFQLNID